MEQQPQSFSKLEEPCEEAYTHHQNDQTSANLLYGTAEIKSELGESGRNYSFFTESQ